MKFVSAILLMVTSLTSAIAGSALGCEGVCPQGFISICVARGSDCRCSCASSASKVSNKLRDIFERYRIPSRDAKQAVQTYRIEAERNKGSDFSFEFSSQRDTFKVTVTKVVDSRDRE